MKLFDCTGSKVKQLKSNSLKLEREIQNLVEENLKEFFSIEFVKSEFTVNNFRIDTLGFDPQNNSFVIIEYKKGKSYSVIDQGYTYMSLLLNNKSDFILEYNENNEKSLKRDDIDWSQSKIVFISPKFTEYQKHSVNFKDVPFELWEISRFENEIVGFTQYQTSSNESISTTNKSDNTIVEQVSKEVTKYTEDYHLNQSKVKESTKDVYFELKERVLNLGDGIDVVARKLIVGFECKGRFFDVFFTNDYLRCWLNLKIGELDDPKGICRDVSHIGRYGNGDYDLIINKDTDLDYVMFLIKQSFKKHE